MAQEQCIGENCKASATLYCPDCYNLGIKSPFCEECLKKNWKAHEIVHTNFCLGTNDTLVLPIPNFSVDELFGRVNQYYESHLSDNVHNLHSGYANSCQTIAGAYAIILRNKFASGMCNFRDEPVVDAFWMEGFVRGAGKTSGIAEKLKNTMEFPISGVTVEQNTTVQQHCWIVIFTQSNSYVVDGAVSQFSGVSTEIARPFIEKITFQEKAIGPFPEYLCRVPKWDYICTIVYSIKTNTERSKIEFGEKQIRPEKLLLEAIKAMSTE